MAQDLKQFSERIRQIAQGVAVNVDREVIKTAGVIISTVIPATPVDTGRARGNWQVSVGEPVTQPRERLDKTGGGAISEGISRASSYRRGQTIFITNNVPYIGMLNAGSSSQAPANFVEMAVRAAIRYVRGARIVGDR